MDKGAWHAEVHGVAKSQTGLSNWTKLIRDRNQLVVPEAESKGKQRVITYAVNGRHVLLIWWKCSESRGSGFITLWVH